MIVIGLDFFYVKVIIMNLKEVLTAEENQKLFLLGNEAAVRGALEAGGGSCIHISWNSFIRNRGMFFSKLAEDAGIYFEFSTNEKVALEVAASAAAIRSAFIHLHETCGC